MAHAGALEVWREHAQRPIRIQTKKRTTTRTSASMAERAPRITA
jgi:hypothetical protein